MTGCEKEYGIMDMVKDGLGYVSKLISASMFPPIADGAEMVMKTIENRMIRIEKRLLRKLSSLLVMCVGGLFLIFGLFFFLKEFLGWGNAASCFSIGIIVFVMGFLLKAGGSNR